MQSRYFTPALSLLFLFCAHAARAQGTPSSRVGYLRFWNMLPASNGSFDLRKAGNSPSEPALFSHATSYRYSSYVEIAPARYRLEVCRTGNSNTVLKTLDVDIKPNTFFTIIVSPRSIEVVNDTNDPKSSSSTLIIRNYFAGLTVTVSSAQQSIVDALPYGQSYVATGLPLSRLPLTLHTQLPNGIRAESGAEADFKASKRATVLIIPDSYGRFRPRVTIDGKNL